jgi:hypothetical protein
MNDQHADDKDRSEGAELVSAVGSPRRSRRCETADHPVPRLWTLDLGLWTPEMNHTISSVPGRRSGHNPLPLHNSVTALHALSRDTTGNNGFPHEKISPSFVTGFSPCQNGPAIFLPFSTLALSPQPSAFPPSATTPDSSALIQTGKSKTAFFFQGNQDAAGLLEIGQGFKKAASNPFPIQHTRNRPSQSLARGERTFLSATGSCCHLSSVICPRPDVGLWTPASKSTLLKMPLTTISPASDNPPQGPTRRNKVKQAS